MVVNVTKVVDVKRVDKTAHMDDSALYICPISNMPLG